MKRLNYEWDPRPPTVGERVVCAVWLAAFLIAAASYYADWRLLGGYDKWAFGGLFIGGLMLLARLPGVKRT